MGGKREAALVACFEGRGGRGFAASQDGSTALTIAARAGHADIVKLLLDRGAFVELRADVRQASCSAHACLAGEL